MKPAPDPEKLLKLYGDNPQFDLDFAALRAPEMAPLVKFLATSPEYLRNVPEDLHDLLVKRWRLPEPKAAIYWRPIAGFQSRIGRDCPHCCVEQRVEQSNQSTDPQADQRSLAVSCSTVVANSANATKGAFGKIQSEHAKLNGLSTNEVVASDLRATDIEVVRERFKEAQKAVADELLNAGYRPRTLMT